MRVQTSKEKKKLYCFRTSFNYISVIQLQLILKPDHGSNVTFVL